MRNVLYFSSHCDLYLVTHIASSLAARSRARRKQGWLDQIYRLVFCGSQDNSSRRSCGNSPSRDLDSMLRRAGKSCQKHVGEPLELKV